MTYYDGASTDVTPYMTSPRPPVGSPVLRGVLGAFVCLAGIAGAVVAGFIAVIVWTGCFISCSGENHAGGAALGILAALSLASGPAAVSGLFRSGRWMRVAVGVFALGTIGALLALASS